ncbi:MAG: haloacid dehalogenase type II [Pseudomonadota bacterium]|nr:haloacid dehalogenase type II [Pseudomonadota bacterium]
MHAKSPRPAVLLFDVNETLLDIGPLKQKVGDLLQDPTAATLWFTTMLQYSLVMTVSGQYAAFGDVGAAALQMLARNSDLSIDAGQAKAVLAGMRSLLPHADVKPALERLQRGGVRMATLTNSPQAGVQAQMEHAGLVSFFERQLSVETIGKFKPHHDVYEWAAREMGAEPGECMLVAAHGWDVAGAKWAGMQTAFIAREGQQKFPLAAPPDVDVSDLAALAVHFRG